MSAPRSNWSGAPRSRTAVLRCCAAMSGDMRSSHTTARPPSSNTAHRPPRRPPPVTPSSERPVPLTPDLLRKWPLPPPQEDKHARGVVLIVGGAGRTPGAALLAGIASLRVGAGQLRLAVADTAASAMAVAVPEALVAPLGTAPESGDITVEAVRLVLEQAQGIDVLCLGPGLSGDRASRDLTTALIGKLDPSVNVVLDAMALTALRAGLR